MKLVEFKETRTHKIITILGIIKIKKKLPYPKYTNIMKDESAIFDGTLSNPYAENKVSIGKKSIIRGDIIFESDKGEIEIGDRVFINASTKLISRSKIKIGNDVTIAWGCTIYDHNSHSLDYRERIKDIEQVYRDYKTGDFIKNKNWKVVKTKPITICDKVWIGFDCLILNGVTIGEGAILGAKTVVREDVEPWTVVAGNPARVIKRLRHD